MHRLARYRSGRVELWITPCVVTMPPPRSTALVVPTNERLCGTQFAHFPKGGPTPAATKIGERDYDRPRAERLLYQCESVDGIVTEFGGAAYESAIAELPLVGGDADYPVRCKTGNAVRVPIATGPLAAFGDGLILAVPPFYASLSWRGQLLNAYSNAFSLGPPTRRVATPLLGAGTRGAPVAEAAAVAAEATRECLAAEAPAVQASIETLLDQDEGESAIQYAPQTIRFCVLDDDVGEIVDSALDEALTWNMT